MVVQTVPGGEAPEYDTEIMAILRRTRKEFLDFLESTTLPFPQILKTFLLYAYDVQAELDGSEPAVLSHDVTITGVTGNVNAQLLLNFFSGLEILTPQWKARLNTPVVSPQWTPQHKALLHYFIQRYWL